MPVDKKTHTRYEYTFGEDGCGKVVYETGDDSLILHMDGTQPIAIDMEYVQDLINIFCEIRNNREEEE